VLQNQGTLANIRRLQIGIIFQHYNLVPVLTALENVMLPVSILDMPEEKKRAKAIDLLEKVGLKDKGDRLPSQLSGGEQQRVSIARALANDPVIILADEPTGNLDQKTSREIIKLFESLNTDHKQTFFIVTHDPAIASRTHRIIKIRDGLIEAAV
jgi:putative ABC transport system ATP-binding protein